MSGIRLNIFLVNLFISSSSSSSDEEDTLQFWQDQRQKAKEASLSCARQNNGGLDHRQPRKPPEKHKNAVEEIKPVHSGIHAKFNKTVVGEQILTKVDTREGIDTGKTLVGRGTSTNLHNVELNIKDEHKVAKNESEGAVKQAWVVSAVSPKDKPYKDSVIQDEKKTPEQEIICRSTAKNQNLPSPKKVDSEAVNSKISPGRRDHVSSVDSEVKTDLISSKNDEVKRTSVKHKQVLTEEEKAKRQRLQRSLQNLKPQLSSHNHHPAAPCTPILFHEVTCKIFHFAIILKNHHHNNTVLLNSFHLNGHTLGFIHRLKSQLCVNCTRV